MGHSNTAIKHSSNTIATGSPISLTVVTKQLSRRLLSRRRLFRIAFFNGAAWFSLLERDRIARRANFDGDSRYRHVGDPNCRLALRACAVGEKDLGARLAQIDEGSRLVGELWP